MRNKRAIYLLLSILILLIVPFFMLSFFNHPSADDYSFSHLIRAWGRLGYQDFMYNHWQGRYFANFIFSYNPLTFDSFIGYKMFPVFLLIAFVLSVVYLIFVFFKDHFNATSKIIVAIFLILLYLNIIPSPSETLYWITGSIEYFIPGILTLVFLSVVVHGLRKKGHKLKSIIIAGILGFCICGCNEVNIIFLLEILILIVLFNLKDHSVIKFILPILAVVILSALLDIMAPGNYLRMANFSKSSHILYGVEEALISDVKLLGIHLKSPAFLIITILSLPILSAVKNKTDKPLLKMNPWIACTFVVFIFFSLFFSVSYSTGIPSPLRIYNTTSVLFIITWFYLVYLFIYYYDLNFQIPKFFQTLLVIATVIFFITGFEKVPRQGLYFSGNISRAFYDLAFKAQKYNDELNNRYEMINVLKAKRNCNLTVPELSVKPGTIFFIDIEHDSTSWVNIGTAQYFGINSIKLK
jgi:hypothetical protein